MYFVNKAKVYYPRDSGHCNDADSNNYVDNNADGENHNLDGSHIDGNNDHNR